MARHSVRLPRVRSGREPVVSGEDGLGALAIADLVVSALEVPDARRGG